MVASKLVRGVLSRTVRSSVLLIDANSVLFPAMYGAERRCAGQADEVLHGVASQYFFSKVNKVISMVNPTHCAFIFDGASAKTTRNDHIASHQTVAATEIKEKDLGRLTPEFHREIDDWIDSFSNYLGSMLDDMNFLQFRLTEIEEESKSIENLEMISQDWVGKVDKHELLEEVKKCEKNLNLVSVVGNVEFDIKEELACVSQILEAAEDISQRSGRQTTRKTSSLLFGLASVWERAVVDARELRLCLDDMVRNIQVESPPALEQLTKVLEYPMYKSQRKPLEERKLGVFPKVWEELEVQGLFALRKDASEADDVIGSLAKQIVAQDPDAHVYILSTDKDFNQLIDDRITFLCLKGKSLRGQLFEERNLDWFAAEFPGLNPAQYIDILAMVGDTADSIPGVPFIGIQRAKKLLQQYPSVEAVLEANKQSKVTGERIKKSLETHERAALLGKKLVTIDCDVNLSQDLANWKETLLFQRNELKESDS